MLEIRISAPDLAEAINNLAQAISLAATSPNGTTAGVAPINTTYATVEEPAALPAEATEAIAHALAPVAAPAPAPELTATPAPVSPVIPTAAPQYTLDMIARAGTALVDAGKIGKLTALLAKYGVEALTALDPAMYGTIAMELRNLGAQI